MHEQNRFISSTKIYVFNTLDSLKSLLRKISTGQGKADVLESHWRTVSRNLRKNDELSVQIFVQLTFSRVHLIHIFRYKA